MANPIEVIFPPNVYTSFADLTANNLFSGTNKFGNATDYTQITSTGRFSLNGGATVFDDLRVDLANIKAPAADPPTWSAYKGSELPMFSPTKAEVVYFRIQLPHGYKEGTDIYFHLHTAYPDSLAGNSVWQFTYSWANVNVAFPAPTTVLSTTASSLLVDKHVIHNFGTLSGTGKLISSILLCSLSRLGADAADTYANSIYTVSADFHYEIDTLGSDAEYVK